MNISPTSLTAQSTSELLNLNQQVFIEKTNQTVSRVFAEVLQLLVTAQNMELKQFIATHVTPLTGVDARTHQFFMKILNAIYQNIESKNTLQAAFDVLAIVAQDPLIRNKLVENIAFPHVETLIAELDAINPSIVDDVNAS